MRLNLSLDEILYVIRCMEFYENNFDFINKDLHALLKEQLEYKNWYKDET